MQPYFLPYLGYWQLMNFVDKFVIYDDVNFIKGGWVNRNRIIVQNQPCFLTVPLSKSSSFRKISDIEVHQEKFWRQKMMRTVEMSYKNAQYFSTVFPIVEQILSDNSAKLSQFLFNQLRVLARFMGIQTALVESSRTYENSSLRGEARLLDICRRENATTYINMDGGRSLYCRSNFNNAGFELQFLEMLPWEDSKYPGLAVSRLSVLHSLMTCGPEVTFQKLSRFTIH